MTRKRQALVLAALLTAILAAVFLSFNLGYSSLSIVRMQIRLPRIILALLCGMGLALSGCTLQAVTENPLADPGILGINAGAGFMVMLFLILFPSLHVKTMLYQPLFAMAGGLLAAFLLYRFSKRNGKIRPAYLLLGGIGVSAGFSSLMLIMSSNMQNSSYQLVTRWLSGNIWGTSWHQVKSLIPYLRVMVPLLFSRANVLDLLFLGEDAAGALGVSIERERKLLLLSAVGLAASCVSVSGGIGFIGLVAPHIARQFAGARHRVLLLASMLTGGLLLLLADTLGRCLIPSVEIPVGIVISVLAAPYFLYLLGKQM
ncbi:FecCD family ABC transporter permease [Novisyntrophococcus fermenticellae]|uniref:FecCD family ABC transporter permease n=1 Tax=Novisyntrophococcus fermenticellae TaxID=2068655 RepID=UPI001E51FA24|nr:iron ABC transporter permease [Novisyntrophococcus fermenticellae]